MRAAIARTIAVGTLAAAALLTVACADTLAPRTVAGTYVLAAPPAPVVIGVDEVDVTADTLVVRDDGTASQHVRGVRRPVAGGDGTPFAEAWHYTYRLTGSGIGLLWECPPGQTCAAVAMRRWYDVLPNGSALRPRQEPGLVYVRVGAAP